MFLRLQKLGMGQNLLPATRLQVGENSIQACLYPSNLVLMLTDPSVIYFSRSFRSFLCRGKSLDPLKDGR